MPDPAWGQYLTGAMVTPLTAISEPLQHGTVHGIDARERAFISRDLRGDTGGEAVVEARPSTPCQQGRKLCESRLVILPFEPELPEHVAEEHRLAARRRQETRQTVHEVLVDPIDRNAGKPQRPTMPPMEKEWCGGIQFDQDQSTDTMQERTGDEPTRAGADDDKFVATVIPAGEEPANATPEGIVCAPMPQGSQMPPQPAARAQRAPLGLGRRPSGGLIHRTTRYQSERVSTMRSISKRRPPDVMTGLFSAALCMIPVTETHATAASAATPAPHATESCVMATTESIDGLFRTWNLALATLDSGRVAALYWPDAVLLPTVSNVPRTDASAIKEYFDHFLQRHPRGTIVSRTMFHGCNMSVDTGLYDFALMDPSGKATVVSARYTFVYAYKDGQWKIRHHHSSAMPEATGSAPAHAPAHQDEHGAGPGPAPHAGAAAVRPGEQPDNPAAGRASAAPAGGQTPAGSVADPTIRLGKTTRTPQSYLARGHRLQSERETVGIKVCASTAQGPRSFDLTDPAPQAEVNDAALRWARASRWDVNGTPTGERPVCAQVVVRFNASLL